MGWLVNPTARPFYPREKDPVYIVQEAGWVPGSAWRGAEKLSLDGINLRGKDTNLGQGTGYPNSGFCDFPEPQQAKSGILHQINHDHLIWNLFEKNVDVTGLQST